MEITSAVDNSGDSELIKKFQTALGYIKETTGKYGPHQVALSFNGGKDCTVILHLVRAAFALAESANEGMTPGTSASTNHPPSNPDFSDGASTPVVRQQPGNFLEATCTENGSKQSALQARERQSYPIRTLYFDSPDAFPEMHKFTKDCALRYALQLEVLEGEYASALHSHLQLKPLKAIFLGTRSDDPNAPCNVDSTRMEELVTWQGGQEVYAPSTYGWPCFMRVNPILDWTYRDVWAFLLVTRVPYCSLYNHGYTSIGNIHNTLPNEALRIWNANSAIPISNGDGFREGDENEVLESLQKYRPAYHLLDGTLERAGRTKTIRSNIVESKEVNM